MDRSLDIVTLIELDWTSREEADAVLSEQYEYSYAVGTVGIWSVYPLFDGEALDLGLGWNRALRITVEASGGRHQRVPHSCGLAAAGCAVCP